MVAIAHSAASAAIVRTMTVTMTIILRLPTAVR